MDIRRRASAAFLLWLLIPARAAGHSEVPQPDGTALTARQLPAAVQPAANLAVNAVNQFAPEIYGRARSSPGNLILSPFSISTAFAMIYAGAGGATRTEMSKVFHFAPDPATLHPAFKALLASLNRGSAFGGYQLDVADRVWVQSGVPLLQAFLEVTRESYGAEARQLDFRDAGGSTDTINSWVAAATHGQLPDVVPAGTIGPLTRLVLANAVYFKGLWETPFMRAGTRPGSFHRGPGDSVTVPMMSMEEDLPYSDTAGVEIVEKPYRGADLSWIGILPHLPDGLPALESRLTPGRLGALLAGVTRTKTVQLVIPRFRFDSRFDLIPALRKLGMGGAFDAGRADFSAVDGKLDLQVGMAVHAASVSVDEAGTEATAATAVVMLSETRERSLQAVFRANHPFLFLIRDNVTGAILFMGRVADPSK